VETGGAGVGWLIRTAAGARLIQVEGPVREAVVPGRNGEGSYLARAGGEVVLVHGGRRYLVVDAPWSVPQPRRDSPGGRR
jgi:hypothetical protein